MKGRPGFFDPNLATLPIFGHNALAKRLALFASPNLSALLGVNEQEKRDAHSNIG
tara:strand:- start:537 stop:701 length:165 start_codon:yes stop_codon:yes gene_type:complete